jgi:hypothetical protein
MGVLRLSTVFPDLADAISSAPAYRALNAGWAAAQWAVHQTGLSHPVVSAAKVGESTDAIVALVTELDDQYFELQEFMPRG